MIGLQMSFKEAVCLLEIPEKDEGYVTTKCQI